MLDIYYNPNTKEMYIQHLAHMIANVDTEDLTYKMVFDGKIKNISQLKILLDQLDVLEDE